MNRFIRWYNQNRKKVWKAIAIVVIVIGVIQLINYYYQIKNEEELKSSTNRNQVQNEIINDNYNTISIGDTNSSLTGEQISTNQETQLGVIDNFINYCNENNLQGAYNLLTDECKEEMYPTIEAFQESYYNRVFNNSRKNVSVENWIDNIYKVNINEDILSTGKYSKEDTIQDYITVVETDEVYQLNINEYIGRREIGKSKEDQNIMIEVEEIDMYMDYQIYKIKVMNQYENTILLDNGVQLDTMYIEDENGIQYAAYTHEINEGQLVVSSRETKELEIKYYSKYSSEKDINKLVFSRIVLNNEEYQAIQNKNLYREYGNIEVEI